MGEASGMLEDGEIDEMGEAAGDGKAIDELDETELASF